MSIVGLAAHRLPGARIGTFPTDVLPVPAWRQLTGEAAAHGLGGLLADAAWQRAFPTNVDQRAQALEAHATALSVCLLLEAAAVEVVEVLASHGIEALVANGTVAAHLDYPDPSLRPFGDIDLLVRPNDIDRAAGILATMGFRSRDHRQPMRLADDRHRQVELQTSLVSPGVAAMVQLDDLWLEPGRMTLAGHAVPTVSEEARLVTSCLRSLRVGSRLVMVRDVVQQVLAGRAEVERVIDLAGRWQARRGLALAISAAWDRFELADVVALSAWARRYRPNGDEDGFNGRTRRARHGIARRWLARR